MLHGYQKPLSGEKVGVVFGSFAPLHQGHLDCIMRAKKENDGGCIVIVCGFDGDKGGEMMPLKRRYRYVREFFADDDLVAVYAINDGEIGAKPYPDGWEQWLDEFYKIFEKAVEKNYVDSPAPTLMQYYWPKRHWYAGDPNYISDLMSAVRKQLYWTAWLIILFAQL